MHGKQSLLRAALAAAVLVVGATASADPKDDKHPSPSGANSGKEEKGRGRRDGHGWSDGHENGDGHGERTGGRGRDEVDGRHAPAGAHREEREEADDELRKEESTETHEKRKDYLRKSKGDFEAIVKPSGRPLSQAETEVIKTHWRRTMRLWRIRTVAEKAKDSQSVAKVDTLLVKAHEVTKAKLQELRATEGGGTK